MLSDLLGLHAPTGEEWTEAFAVQLVPHASIYLGPEGMLGGESAERIAGFWRALRIPVPACPDHLTALLGLYARLIETEEIEPDGPRRVLLGHARAALLHEHLLSWLLPYTRAMSEVAPPVYAAWARLLGEAIRGEAEQTGPPQRLPAHLHAAPPPAGPNDGVDAVMEYLLCPVRSGVVIARGHIAGLARDGGFGLRLGDRRRVLRAVIGQDPATAVHLLADRAQAWAVRHQTDVRFAGPIAAHWADRATVTAGMLRGGPQEPSPAGTAEGHER